MMFFSAEAGVRSNQRKSWGLMHDCFPLKYNKVGFLEGNVRTCAGGLELPDCRLPVV